MVAADFDVERVAEGRAADGFDGGGGGDAHFHEAAARSGGAGEFEDLRGLAEWELIECHGDHQEGMRVT